MKLDKFIEKYGNLVVNEEELKETLGIKDKKYFIPKENDDYYWVNISGTVNKFINREISIGEAHFENNELFATKEEAEKYAKKKKFLLQMKRDFLDNSEEIDWEDDDQKKYYLKYTYKGDEVFIHYNCYLKTTGLVTTNRVWLEEYISENEEEIRKYYFEVEEEEVE